jgi:DNA-binding CsgD family transcriptional regulator
MLGSIYKRGGQLSKALDLFLQSKEEAQRRNDDLGVLNSLHMIIDLFLYWNVPEYANSYATEAIRFEKKMTKTNPMVSAQTYINKGRALLQLGENDSVAIYTEKARELCKSLPYNSGMVDVDLLHGIYQTGKGGDSMHSGIQELQQVTRQGTATNRAKAYHQLAQTYLKCGQNTLAETMLDSMYSLLKQSDSHIYIQADYKPIINHYLQNNNQKKVEQYTAMMLREQETLKEKKLNFNLVEAITDLQTEQQRHYLEIIRLEQANQRLWFIIYTILSVVIISAVVSLLFYQKRQHKTQIKKAGDKLASLIRELNQTNAEKEIISQEFEEIMSDKENRQEIETLTPSILQKNGESRFRQRFELLYPLFLPRLRERVPTITRREELLSMLIVLKQDNKEIAELLAIAPRSVLMLRHRFRQKIGMNAEYSLENFIEEILEPQNSSDKANEE